MDQHHLYFRELFVVIYSIAKQGCPCVEFEDITKTKLHTVDFSQIVFMKMNAIRDFIDFILLFIGQSVWGWVSHKLLQS